MRHSGGTVPPPTLAYYCLASTIGVVRLEVMAAPMATPNMTYSRPVRTA
jgi:hypothetical protein